MKILPENIDDIDALYKAKSEEDFSIDLPNGFWTEIESQLPNAPLVPGGAMSSGASGGVKRAFNLYYAAAFYTAGVLSAVLAYWVYIRVTHQENSASIQIVNPVLEKKAEKEGETIPEVVLESINNSEKTVVKKDVSSNVPKFGTTKKDELGGEKYVQSVASSQDEVENEQRLDAVTLPVQNEVPQKENKTVETEVKQASKVVQEEKTDFYQKHSKKVNDSLAKKLFIQKK